MPTRPPPKIARIYDKGDRRHRHVGRNPYPEFNLIKEPQYFVGLCPNNLTHADHQALLDEAIPASNGDRFISVPKRLHVVHEGAVYRAETTDWGKSYHGYPYRGKLGSALIEQLQEMAKNKGCQASFEEWIAKYIERHGK